MKKFLKILFRVLGIVIIAVIVLAVAVIAFLPLTVPKIANWKLPELLRAEASLGSFSLGVFRGQAALGALRIAQPPGFGEEVLISLPRMGVTVKPASLLSPPLVVEEVVLE
ncbi:MAG: hypothetical protein NTV79_08085, partial [Candidatus Aureabacteria bacterium]|nr:hypothetical protein [Candidatus Auribacterota bacterium]